jgi:mutator protein MutT
MIQMLKTLDVVAAIIEQDGKILLAQRPPHADQPGLWEFAGGKVEPGESQPQALIRELQEELGITAEVERYIASHQREVSGRLIHLHAWWVARFQRLPPPTITASCAGARRKRPNLRPCSGRYSAAERLYRPTRRRSSPLIPRRLVIVFSYD